MGSAVFEAARKLGIKSVVWASSETVLGIPFLEKPPYLPLDEEYEGRPESAYSLAKWLGEKMGDQFVRWDKTAKIIGLRFSNVMDPAAGDYSGFESWQDRPQSRSWNFWGYIDARDAGDAVLKALLASQPSSSLPAGSHNFIIANADTVMRTQNKVLLEKLPDVERRGEWEGNRTLLGIGKARKVIRDRFLRKKSRSLPLFASAPRMEPTTFLETFVEGRKEIREALITLEDAQFFVTFDGSSSQVYSCNLFPTDVKLYCKLILQPVQMSDTPVHAPFTRTQRLLRLPAATPLHHIEMISRSYRRMSS
jgi:hypothetical protein